MNNDRNGRATPPLAVHLNDDQLGRYYDGVDDHDERRRTIGHLDRCLLCWWRFESMREELERRGEGARHPFTDPVDATVDLVAASAEDTIQPTDSDWERTCVWDRRRIDDRGKTVAWSSLYRLSGQDKYCLVVATPQGNLAGRTITVSIMCPGSEEEILCSRDVPSIAGDPAPDHVEIEYDGRLPPGSRIRIEVSGGGG